MNYLKKLSSKDVDLALRRVNKKFDNAYYYKTLFRFNIFKEKYPYEYSNIGIDKIKGNCKKLHDYLFNQSLKWIGPIREKLTDRIAKDIFIKRYKSPNKSSFKKFYKLTLME